MNINTGTLGSYGVYLGVGSYLGADNLRIKVSSKASQGIHCFGCTLDGDRFNIVTAAANSEPINSSLGLLELRWAKFVVNGENSKALKVDMGSFTNVLEDSQFISNDSGPALELVESGLYFSTGRIQQNGMGAAIYLSNLADHSNEFRSLQVSSRSIGFLIKNAKNLFLKDVIMKTGGARMVNLGNDRG